MKRPVVSSVLLCVGLVVGCAAATVPAGSVPPSAAPTDVASPTIGPPEAALPTPGPTIPTLGDDQALEPGTYRLNRFVVGPQFPPILLTVPDGWHGGGWLANRPTSGEDIPPVSVQFWDVHGVYRHPCQWKGTLFLPGPTAEDLAEALVEVPLRNATEPIDVTIDGYPGKYLEWSVPADSNFSDCDREGEPYFQSWTGLGAAGGRYQQGPGQIDRVWMLDMNGVRLVIDAFSMPSATSEEIEELLNVVESITVER